jgi:restriction system protein
MTTLHASARITVPDATLKATMTVSGPPAPVISLGAVLTFAGSIPDGRLVEAVAVPWFLIMERIRNDPDEVFRIPPETWEQLIAGAYREAGFDEVILTPRSGDHGRDVIATRNGIGSVRIYDQVKAYAPGHLVPANDVRALVGTLHGNVSKGVFTTTSDFAPRLLEDPVLASLHPHRLELRPGSVLVPWLSELSARRKQGG